jgi:WD40 repeat protein
VIAGAPVIISGSWDKTIFRWDSRTGEPIDGPLEGHSGEVTSVAFGVIDGVPVIVSGSWDKTIRYWDAQKGALIGEPLERHAGAVTSVAFGVVDGAPVIVSGGDDGTVRLWDGRKRDISACQAISTGQPIQFCGTCPIGGQWTAVTAA